MSMALAFLGFWLGLSLGVIFHEMGHFTAARVGKLPVLRVSAGAGPLLSRWQHRETTFELRLLPLSGAVAITPSFHRGRAALFVLGGMLGNIALLLAAGALDARLAAENPMHRVLHAIAAAQYWMIALNLVPHRVKAGGKRLASDGLLLLSIGSSASMARRFLKHQLSPYQAQPEARPGATAFAARIAQELSSVGKWASPADRLKSIEALEDELLHGGLPEGEELFVLDVLITCGLTADDPSPFRQRLDEWSQRAMKLGAHLPTIRGSRGAVLALLGRHSEAKSLLETVPTDKDAPPMDVLMTKLFLGRALLGLGERSKASGLLREARSAANNNQPVPGILKLIARVEAEIATEVGCVDGTCRPDALN